MYFALEPHALFGARRFSIFCRERSGMASGDHPMRLPSRDPHLEAQREYTDRYANLALGRENWRRIAFVSALACALAAVAVIVMALQPRAVPYIVQVDKIGQVMSVTPAQRDGAPPQAVVK